jgi:hypothetical protein
MYSPVAARAAANSSATPTWLVVGIGNGPDHHIEVHNLKTRQKVHDKRTGQPATFHSAAHAGLVMDMAAEGHLPTTTYENQ